MKGYRTIVTNGIVIAFSIIEFVTGEAIAVDDQTALIAGVLAAINVGYRFVTTTPVGVKS